MCRLKFAYVHVYCSSENQLSSSLKKSPKSASNSSRLSSEPFSRPTLITKVREVLDAPHKRADAGNTSVGAWTSRCEANAPRSENEEPEETNIGNACRCRKVREREVEIPCGLGVGSEDGKKTSEKKNGRNGRSVTKGVVEGNHTRSRTLRKMQGGISGNTAIRRGG